MKRYNKIFTKMWGVYALLWDTVYIKNIYFILYIYFLHFVRSYVVLGHIYFFRSTRLFHTQHIHSMVQWGSLRSVVHHYMYYIDTPVSALFKHCYLPKSALSTARLGLYIQKVTQCNQLECNNTACSNQNKLCLVLKWLLLAQRMALAAYKHIWRVMLSAEH